MDSNKQECQSNGNAKQTKSAGESSPDTGRTPPASQTLEVSAFTQNQRNEVRELDVAGALAAEPGMKQQTYLLFNPYRTQTEPGESVEGFKEDTIHDALTKQAPPEGRPLICSAEDSPAKTSPLPDDAPASQESAAGCSLSSPELPMTLFGQEDGSSLRTFPDSFPQTVAEISPSFTRRWPSSGFTTSPGECWTADTSECPSDGGEYSSLQDVLEDQVPERFYLSQKAAAGILRRAEKRGRELPKHLHKALTELAES